MRGTCSAEDPGEALHRRKPMSACASGSITSPWTRTFSRGEGVFPGAIIVGIIFAGFAAIAVSRVPVVEFAWVLMAQGVGVVIVGLLGLNCNDATERRLWILGGILLVAAALAGSLALGSEVLLARQWFPLISPLTRGLVLFGGGLYLTSRA